MHMIICIISDSVQKPVSVVHNVYAPILPDMFSQYNLLAAAIICFSLALVTGAKRLFRHPLSKYPGPGLAALTLWYKAYYDIIKDGGWVEHLEVLHEQYGNFFMLYLREAFPTEIFYTGPVVRIAPNEVCHEIMSALS